MLRLKTLQKLFRRIHLPDSCIRFKDSKKK
jgi:hypothetical protein